MVSPRSPRAATPSAAQALSGVGDGNADGLADVLVAASRSLLWLFDDLEEGGELGSEEAAAVISCGTQVSSGDSQWGLAEVGDLDHDGWADVFVGAAGASPTLDYDGEEAGAVYLFYGPLSGVYSLVEADLILSGESYGDHAGYALAGLADLDSDTIDDIVVGVPDEGEMIVRGFECGPGSAYVLPGSMF